MSWSYTGEAITCTFLANEFTYADFTGDNAGKTYLVKLGASTIASAGGPLPLVQKTNALNDRIYGVAVGIDGDGSVRNSTPTPRRIRVVRNGIVRVTRFGGITYGAIGQSLKTHAGDPGTADLVDLTVPANKGQGRGLIVGVTGLTTDDYLIVDFDVDPLTTS